jgi:phosphomethylpyrimidine synthase
MDLSTGGDLDLTRQRDHRTQHGADRHRADLLDDHRQEDRGPRRETVLETLEHQAQQGVDYFTIHAGVRREHLPSSRIA